MTYLSPAVLRHNEKVAATIRKAENICRKNTLDAVKLLGKVVRDESASDADRLKAAGMIIDRVMGKAPARLDVAIGSTKMAEAFEAMLVPDEESPRSLPQRSMREGEPFDDVVDAEVVDDD